MAFLYRAGEKGEVGFPAQELDFDLYLCLTQHTGLPTRSNNLPFEKNLVTSRLK